MNNTFAIATPLQACTARGPEQPHRIVFHGVTTIGTAATDSRWDARLISDCLGAWLSVVLCVSGAGLIGFAALQLARAPDVLWLENHWGGFDDRVQGWRMPSHLILLVSGFFLVALALLTLKGL